MAKILQSKRLDLGRLGSRWPSIQKENYWIHIVVTITWHNRLKEDRLDNKIKSSNHFNGSFLIILPICMQGIPALASQIQQAI